jgi:hypothetical protein
MLAPKGVAIEVYKGLSKLPHFNPDLAGTEPLVGHLTIPWPFDEIQGSLEG